MSENEKGGEVVSIDSARDPSPLTQEQRLELKKQFWINVLQQIVDTERFLVWFDQNYTVQQAINEEERVIDTVVIEKPIEDKGKDKLSPDQIFKMHVACTRAGAREPRKLVEVLMKILGQDDIPLITLASDGDVQKAVDASNLRDKLEP